MKPIKTISRSLAVSVLGLGLAVPAMAETLNIGWTGPLSGGAAGYGENVLSGSRMAVEEINAAGGFEVDGKKYTINLVSMDDKYNPAQAATNAKRMAQESGVSVVFVPHSGGVFALQEFNEKENFMIAAYTSVPTVTEKGNSLTIRIPPTFDGYVRAFSKYGLANYGTKLGMGGATHEYAKIWAKMIKAAWEAGGGEVVADNPMDYNKSADFYTGVSRIMAENPDVMFVGGASEPTGLVMQQARQLGYQGAFILMDQAKLDEVERIAGGWEMVNDSVGVVPLSTYDTDAAQDFIKRYEEKYNKVPGSEAAYNYLTLYGIVEAVKMSGSTDAKDIRANIGAAMAKLEAAHNPYEVTDVDEKGGFITEVTMAVVENNKLVRKPIE